MNVFHLNGDIFDLDEVVSKEIELTCVRLIFRNGDELPIRWRDERERGEILESVGLNGRE